VRTWKGLRERACPGKDLKGERTGDREKEHARELIERGRIERGRAQENGRKGKLKRSKRDIEGERERERTREGGREHAQREVCQAKEQVAKRDAGQRQEAETRQSNRAP